MRHLPGAALTLALVAALTAPAFAQAADTAMVLQVRTQLRGVVAPVASWANVPPGAQLKAGDTLKTGDGAAADIVLPSGAHFIMGENTLVRLQSFDGFVSPRVLTGRVRFVAAPAGSTTLIAGDMSVTGTDAEAIVTRDQGNWLLAVLSGKFSVGNGREEIATVEAGKVLTAPPSGQTTIASLNRSQIQDLEAGLRFAPADTPQVTARPTPGPMLRPNPTPAVGATTGANRWIATTLSTLLPGTGQIYTGELGRGLTYMGLNGAMAGVGLFARSTGQNQLATAMAIGLVGLNIVSPLDALFFTQETTPPESR